MPGAEALASAGDGGQRFLRLQRGLAHRPLAEAPVAAPARSRLLVEIGEQLAPATVDALAQHGQRAEAPVLEMRARVSSSAFSSIWRRRSAMSSRL